MRGSLVRIVAIELKGFKNVEHGFIEMPSVLGDNIFSKKADILGLYG